MLTQCDQLVLVQKFIKGEAISGVQLSDACSTKYQQARAGLNAELSKCNSCNYTIMKSIN